MANEFFIPGKIIMGESALLSAMELMKGMGKRPLIVCGPIIKKVGLTKKIIDMLGKEGMSYAVFADITGEPSEEMIEEGIKAYVENRCDFLIGVGGGSPIDAIEAYTSRKAQPLTDLFAISAIRRIFANLATAYIDGEDMEARSEMAMAALEAGIAFNNASVTIVHGMSRPIGALFHVPHGFSNALLLYHCMEYVLDGALDRFAILGKEIGAADKRDSDAVAAQKFLDAIKDICKTCEIGGVEAYGVDKEEFKELLPKMAKDALASGSPGNSRMEIREEDILEIYEKLM